MLKVFYDCPPMREVEMSRVGIFRPLVLPFRPLPLLAENVLLLTAKSNLHVFSKLIVMMAFVDAVFLPAHSVVV